MSNFLLIPDEIYDNLPQDSHDQFVMLVSTAQTNLANMLNEDNSGDFSHEIRSQFVSIISGIASALGVEGLSPISSGSMEYFEYQQFCNQLAGVVARVRLQGKLVAKPFSVELGRVTRAKIQQEISHLRRSVEDSDLPSKKKKVLLGKLDDLEAELAKKRLGFAQTMAIAASIMTVIGGGTAALANAPKAVESVVRIIQLVGEDKEKEETERERLLPPPPKALPDFSTPKPSAFGEDMDDDIPF